MRFPSCGLLLALSASTLGCGPATRPGSVADAPAQSAAARQDPPAPVLDAPASMPEAFIVSTNEPFWHARVEAGAVVLTGPSAQRRFRVEMNDAVFDGRYVLAHDADGSLETRVAVRLCQDSMSGALFPYTARLVIDGGTPIPGCARGLNDPLPTEPAR